MKDMAYFVEKAREIMKQNFGPGISPEDLAKEFAELAKNGGGKRECFIEKFDVYAWDSKEDPRYPGKRDDNIGDHLEDYVITAFVAADGEITTEERPWKYEPKEEVEEHELG